MTGLRIWKNGKQNRERRQLLAKIKGKVSDEYMKKERVFRAAYNGMKVFKEDME